MSDCTHEYEHPIAKDETGKVLAVKCNHCEKERLLDWESTKCVVCDDWIGFGKNTHCYTHCLHEEIEVEVSYGDYINLLDYECVSCHRDMRDVVDDYIFIRRDLVMVDES